MEWLIEIINSPNINSVICFLFFFSLTMLILAKFNILKIHTRFFSLGSSQSELRDRLMETAYTFIMGLSAKIGVGIPNYNEWKCKYILMVIYCEVVKWILHDNIIDDEDYISSKNEKLKSLFYGMSDINDMFKTDDFSNLMDSWTHELIRRLLESKKIYYSMKK